MGWRVLGVDLAWAQGAGAKAANESGVVAADDAGRVLDAEWTVGVAATVDWIRRWASDSTLLMVDAPLVVNNPSDQRVCERQVGQRYGRWKVSANSTNRNSPRLAGLALRQALESSGWRYEAGFGGPPASGRVMSECYPYTAIVGCEEFGYAVRPPYKRKPRGMGVAAFRPMRAAACDGLLARLAALGSAFDLGSHAVTAELVGSASPLTDRDYKHREDLLDASLCVWSGLLWLRYGFGRCQVLGDPDEAPVAASIIAPAHAAQRAGSARDP